ncbi:hypothetical protein THAOC_37596 [Thalassiosira oceanica]|uniref:Helicase-associated domain-containing protein n=1 Tax=Thalassiosira oceanica TaxID=159749 RepID=K0QY96_THAOC|nr:hypothetical protein THAOC_37596 [Thalassiosira oceanica]|eukprot:EJK43913.1 hypothetical protein THAOC_37596 [Thalassiosira oceanica]
MFSRRACRNGIFARLLPGVSPQPIAHPNRLLRKWGGSSSRRGDAFWEQMFQKLADFKSTHGHVSPPVAYPQLGSFVDNQRQNYRMRMETNDQKFISDGRIERLESLGFVWNLYEEQWNKRFEELKHYVKVNGNALVPTDSEPLGIWVARQRMNYKSTLDAKNLPEDKNEAYLTPQRIKMLESIEFVWNVHDAMWLERLEELKQYKFEYGDTLVPMKFDRFPFLGR